MTPDPFSVLGIAPTVDHAAIKRAYFAALRLHPPHSDPEGFARLRAAYEALGLPADRARLTLEAPIDVAASLRALQARAAHTSEGGRAAGATVDGTDPAAEALAAGAFIGELLGLPLATALDRLAKARSPGG